MSVLYRPRNRAREYGELAVNLYGGCCPHKCAYCYVAGALRTSREDWLSQEFKPRPNIVRLLEKDLARLAATPDSAPKPSVFLCFTCDPYPVGVDTATTRAAIELIHKHGLRVSVLTKGGSLALRDADLFRPGVEGDAYGATLTCIDEAHSRYWEPNARPTSDRIEALRAFHALGVRTWVSLEPVLYPEETLALIEATHEFVDEYRVGTLNYHERAKEIDWPKFAVDVVALLERLGASYMLKQDLRRWMPRWLEAGAATSSPDKQRL